MRAFIKRSEDCIKFLKTINPATKGEAYFDEEYYLMKSGESFHGIFSDTRDSFMFKDARLPSFEIPLQFIEIEK